MSASSSSRDRPGEAEIEGIAADLVKVIKESKFDPGFVNRMRIMMQHVLDCRHKLFFSDPPTEATCADLALKARRMTGALQVFNEQIEKELARVLKLEEEGNLLPIKRMLEKIDQGEEVDVAWVHHLLCWMDIIDKVPFPRTSEAMVISMFHTYYTLSINKPLQSRYIDGPTPKFYNVEDDLDPLEAMLDDIRLSFYKLNHHVTTLRDDAGKAIKTLKLATRETKEHYYEIKLNRERRLAAGYTDERIRELNEIARQDAERDRREEEERNARNKATTPVSLVDDDVDVKPIPRKADSALEILSPLQEASEPSDDAMEMLSLTESLPVLTSPQGNPRGRPRPRRGFQRGFRKNTV